MDIEQSLPLRTDTLFDRVVLYLSTALFALTIVLATVQVLVRVLGIGLLGSMTWTEPAARYILIVGTYLGAAVASRNHEHIQMSYVLDKLEERYPTARTVFNLLGACIVVAFVVIALRGTLSSTLNNWSTSIGGIGFVTSGRLYLGISVGLVLMLIYEGLNFRSSVRTFVSERSETSRRTGAEEGE